MDTEQCIADHQNHSKYLAINVESFRASLGEKQTNKQTKNSYSDFYKLHIFFFLFAYSLSNRIFALKGPHGIVEEM